MDPIEAAADVLREARRLVVLSGAGLSTESGVPDFRSAGGTRSHSEGGRRTERPASIWSRFDPSDFEYARFVRDPRGFWELRAKLMDALDLENVHPNAAHEALAGASTSARYLGHVTQNIDGLLTNAGHAHEKLVEVHGSARTVRCLGCDSWFPYETARASVERGVLPPPCASCGAPLKPGTVLFGETLPDAALAQAAEWMRHADAVLVVGSSLVVYPVAALPTLALERGAALVIVNDSATPYDAEADALVRGKAGAVVPALLHRAGL